MQKLSWILTTQLVQKNVITSEKSSICQYGLQIGLEVCLNTIISIMIAILCHMEWEALVFFAVFIPLRSYAGGLHLSKYISCLICSCLSFFGLLHTVKYLSINNGFAMVIIGFSLLLIKLLSPVPDINRPLSIEETVKFGKRLNYTIIRIVILSIVFYQRQMNKMLLMVSVTTLFMVFILLGGKIKYKRYINENR